MYIYIYMYTYIHIYIYICLYIIVLYKIEDGATPEIAGREELSCTVRGRRQPEDQNGDYDYDDYYHCYYYH